MNDSTAPGEGSPTPFYNARPRIERALFSVMLAIRTVHVVQGFTCILTARTAYRRPRLAAAAAAFAALVELLWMAKRDISRGEHDAVATRADAAFGAVGLVALSMATGSVDRTSSLNWMMPLTVGSCLGSAAGVGRGEGAAIRGSSVSCEDDVASPGRAG